MHTFKCHCTHTHTRVNTLTDTHTNEGALSGRMDRLPVCLPPQSSCLIMHAEAVVLGRWRQTHTHTHSSTSLTPAHTFTLCQRHSHQERSPDVHQPWLRRSSATFKKALRNFPVVAPAPSPLTPDTLIRPPPAPFTPQPLPPTLCSLPLLSRTSAF